MENSLNPKTFRFHCLLSLGCLLEYLRKHFSSAVTLSTPQTSDILLDMALQICSAMVYLEDKNFLHCDLV